MIKTKRITALFLSMALILAVVSPFTVAAQGDDWDLTLPSLAEAFNEYFLFGNIWSNHGQMGDPVTVEKYRHHYNTITASNLHKVDAVLGAAPNAWNWNWDTADHIVAFAEESDMKMVWHNLIWHTQSRSWLTTHAGTIEPITRAEAIENMHQFISTVAGRYSGRIFAYDVVNEAIHATNWPMTLDWTQNMRRTGNGLEDDNLTRTRWYDAFANGAVGDECGSDYIFYAFRFARIYDPFAVLYYNDYNEFERNKREAIAAMVESVNERWRNDPLYDGRLLIEGIGMQGHYNLRGWPNTTGLVRAAIQRFAETGARISITELNVYLEGGGIVPTDDRLPELFEEQAVRYSQIFNYFLRYSDNIERVTFFIWQDLPAQQGAWRRWPHSQHPALFDLNRQAKPAFFAVLDALENHTPNISLPFVTEEVRHGNHPERFGIQFLAEQSNFAPITWSIDGEIPIGLELIPSTGVLMGYLANVDNGEYTFTITAENALGSGSREFTLTVNGTAAEIAASPYPYAPPPQPERPVAQAEPLAATQQPTDNSPPATIEAENYEVEYVSVSVSESANASILNSILAIAVLAVVAFLLRIPRKTSKAIEQ
ncbi:MAG: endo-1,4-beta-xylanase [Defluviitaleaceae bacterium]|nr:endo-1,4-beta-xylanase [Defluviitaleaceae bacterium]